MHWREIYKAEGRRRPSSYCLGCVLLTSNAKERKEFFEADQCPVTGFWSVGGGSEEPEAILVGTGCRGSLIPGLPMRL